LAAICALCAFAWVTSIAVAREPETADQRATEANITRATASFLARSQFSHHPLDAQLAGKLLDRYMDALDAKRSLFTLSDLVRLELDELGSLRATLAVRTREGGDTEAARALFSCYLERLRQQVAFDTRLLRGGHLTFEGQDRAPLDRRHADRPADLAAAEELWRQQLRAEFLEEKLAVKPPRDIAAVLIRRHQQHLKTMTELRDDEVLELYLDALARVYDPHSAYLSKESLESQGAKLNLSLVGIGVTLAVVDGLCTIREVVPGGPAALSGALKEGDHIVAIAQDGKPPVEVTGASLNHTVAMVRGPKGSIVTLTILPATGARKLVRLTRAEVRLEDHAAKARLVEWPRAGAQPLRLGIVELPSFYSAADVAVARGRGLAPVRSFLARDKDIGGRGPVDSVRRFLGRSAEAVPSCLPDGNGEGGGGTGVDVARVARDVVRSAALMPTCPPASNNDDGPQGAAADVARLVAKLQAEHIEGLVLDLRRNLGGSVREAVDLAGQFIGGGPVAQTRDASNAIDVKASTGAGARYAGPLVVLTNRFSASASEILAGALQDHGRAVVVGDPSTWGKGTAWLTTPLAGVMDQAGLSHTFDPGAVNVTIEKFYRPSGASTQLRGVEPDIVVPAASGILLVGESQLNDPLPWDTVPPAPRFMPLGQVAPYVGALRAASGERVATDPAFVELGPELARLKARIDDNSVSLNEAERRRERADQKAFQKAFVAEVEAKEAALPVYDVALKAASTAASWGPPGPPASLIKPAAAGAASKAAPDADPADFGSGRAADALVLDEALHILADFVEMLARPSHWGG
jgi:carboxyl-terminal processing protease